MDEDSLRAFFSAPDTIPILSRNHSAAWAEQRAALGIRDGVVLGGEYRVDYVNQNRVPDIAAAGAEGLVSMLPFVVGPLDYDNLQAAGILQAQRQPFLDLRGRGVLVGIVDTGIDFTLPVFRHADGSSRVEWIWDQTLPGEPPAGFPYGAEFSRSRLDAALRSDDPRARIPHRDTVGHGTFLASVAAGREGDGFVGAAPDAGIIAVKLRRAPDFFYERFLIPPHRREAYTAADLMLGVDYILRRAGELRRPVALCLAMGSNWGGHDGRTLPEEYLSRVGSMTGTAVVCAAGNESRAGHHATGVVAAGGVESVELLVGEGADDLLLTLWNGPSDRVAVSLASPTGELVPTIPVRSGARYSADLVLERARVTVEYFLPMRGSGDQLTEIRISRPTPGIWQIHVHGELVLDGTFHLWLPMTGFIDPVTAFLTPSPNYTVVTPATAAGVIGCGAFNGENNALYVRSSWGPTRLPMPAPDLVAPGVGVSGYLPTGPGRMTGTSAAAAIAAGACALMLQWGIVDGNEPTLTSDRIRANLIRGCDRDSARSYPNPQWGYGRLNLLRSLTLMRPM